jgi:hypothetical protein
MATETPLAKSARTAYEAYVKDTGGLNYEGKPCPKWAELPPKIQHAWKAAVMPLMNELQGAISDMLEETRESMTTIQGVLVDMQKELAAK